MYTDANVTKVGNSNSSFVSIPSTGASIWITFEGYFGQYGHVASLTYSSGNGSYPCVTTPDPLVVNSMTGSVTETQVVCRTATGEPEGEYVFTADMGGQLSDPGVDHLFFPSAPVVHSVSGCEDENDGTYNCDTSGGVTISISGSDFGSLAADLLVFVNDEECGDITLDPAVQVITCSLPAGTGTPVGVVVRLYVSTDEYYQSGTYFLVGYAIPVITSIVHEACSELDPQNVDFCPREGGGTLTIFGSNFGVAGSAVIVGSGY